MLVLAVVALIAVTDVTPFIGGGTVIALVTAAVSLLVGMTRSVPQAYREQIESQADQLERQELRLVAADERIVAQGARISALELDNARCNRRVLQLTRIMATAGLDVPAEGS